MANPVVTAITKDEWTAVATNTTTARVHPLLNGARYFHTYRLTGEAAPGSGDFDEAVEFTGTTLVFEHAAEADLYVWCSVENGSVRVDV